MELSVNGYWVTLPWLALCFLLITTLFITLTTEIYQSTKPKIKKGRNYHCAKMFVVVTSLTLVISCNIGCISDLIHVTLCFVSSDKNCSKLHSQIRLTADISYFIAYMSLYFVIISRLYNTFSNTMYRLRLGSMLILLILMVCSFITCATMLVLGYFNLDNKNEINDITVVLFVVFDFTTNVVVLMLFVNKMNKVIVNKTYEIKGGSQVVQGSGNGNKKSNKKNTVNGIDEDHPFSFSNIPSNDGEASATPKSSINNIHLRDYDNLSLTTVLLMDHKQVTLTTIITRLTVLTLIAMIVNTLFAVFIAYYYLFVYVYKPNNNNDDDDDSGDSQRVYGITYCARGFIAAVNSVVVVLNFNFCHRKYYSCCKCCHRCLFKFFATWNSKQINQLSMHLDLDMDTTKLSAQNSIYLTPSSEQKNYLSDN